MSLESEPRFGVKETKRKKLAYKLEKNDQTALDSHAIKMFIELREELKYVTQAEKGDFRLEQEEPFNFRHSGGLGEKYYKFSVKNTGDYFIKEFPKDASFLGGGVYDALTMDKVEKCLKEKGIKDVEILKWKFVFEKEGLRFFVAPWDERLDYENTLDYLFSSSVEGLLTPIEKDLIRKRVEEIRETLWDVLGRIPGDLYSHNIAYDSKTDKLIIFDLQEPNLEGRKTADSGDNDN